MMTGLSQASDESWGSECIDLQAKGGQVLLGTSY